jgi:hypothetical protein
VRKPKGSRGQKYFLTGPAGKLPVPNPGEITFKSLAFAISNASWPIRIKIMRRRAEVRGR